MSQARPAQPAFNARRMMIHDGARGGKSLRPTSYLPPPTLSPQQAPRYATPVSFATSAAGYNGFASRRAGPHRAGLDLPPSLRAAVKKIQGARACVGSSGIGSSGWSQLAPCRICRRVRRRASACLRARPRGPAMPLPPGARPTGAVGSRIQGRGAGTPVRRRAGVVTTMAAVFEFRNLIITARCYHWFWARRRTPPVGTARVYSYTMSSPVRSDDGRDGSRSWLTLH
jgi:hypothetical protein